MKKDNTRDYVTEMLRIYAANGKPTYEEACEKIKDIVRQTSDAEGISPERCAILCDRELRRNSAFLSDILACQKGLELLRKADNPLVLKAVSTIYLNAKTPHRGDISARVRRFAADEHVTEKQVYCFLRDGRRLLAAIRGLRVE